MKCVLEFEATGCDNCLLIGESRGHGECFNYCRHPNNGRKGYNNVVAKNYKTMTIITPDWCPFNLSDETTEGN